MTGALIVTKNKEELLEFRPGIFGEQYAKWHTAFEDCTAFDHDNEG
jgi:hypothetical protein